MRHSSSGASTNVTVRLACVRPAASVHPEPGSNSSLLCLVGLVIFEMKFN